MFYKAALQIQLKPQPSICRSKVRQSIYQQSNDQSLWSRIYSAQEMETAMLPSPVVHTALLMYEAKTRGPQNTSLRISQKSVQAARMCKNLGPHIASVWSIAHVFLIMTSKIVPRLSTKALPGSDIYHCGCLHSHGKFSLRAEVKLESKVLSLCFSITKLQAIIVYKTNACN